jgi:hypothetical protein
MLSLANAIFAIAIRRAYVLGPDRPAILTYTTITINLEGATV